MADLWGYMTQEMGSIAVCEGFYGRPAGVYGTIRGVHSNLGGVI